MTLAIQDWNRHNNVTELCQLIGSPPLLIFISPKAIQISTNDDKRPCTDLLPPNKTTHNHKNEHKHRRTLCDC